MVVFGVGGGAVLDLFWCSLEVVGEGAFVVCFRALFLDFSSQCVK